jgi:hypothetical protein
MGRLTGFTPPAPVGPDTDYVYDPCGNLRKVKENGALVREYTYDDANRISIGPSGTTYEYDACGNLEYIKDSEGTPTETYAWDPLFRLSSYSGEEDVSFTYDPLKRLAERYDGAETSFTYDGISLNQTGITTAGGRIHPGPRRKPPGPGERRYPHLPGAQPPLRRLLRPGRGRTPLRLPPLRPLRDQARGLPLLPAGLPVGLHG